MPLTYQLPKGMTNGELAELDPQLHESMFAICLTTMAVDHGKIDEVWRARVQRCEDEGVHLTSARGDVATEFYDRVLHVLRGMTTNVAHVSDREWSKRLRDMVAEEVDA